MARSSPTDRTGCVAVVEVERAWLWRWWIIGDSGKSSGVEIEKSEEFHLFSCKKLNDLLPIRRVKSLKKKIYEFSILSNVKACSIIFGPRGGKTERPIEPDIWPKNQNHICDILNQFLKHDANELGKRGMGIENFFKNHTKKFRAELDRLQKQNDHAKYPTWDNRLDHFSLDQLGTLSNQLDLKLELVKQKHLDHTKGEFDFWEAAVGGYFPPWFMDDMLDLLAELALLKPLKEDAGEFYKLMRLYFGRRIYDVKQMIIKFCDGVFGGFEWAANTYGVKCTARMLTVPPSIAC
ncbi:hypothetical protein NE237_014909 [Protea cynaroides]|uniref:Uncharacterized protein n=1 Tax=Protea cynaroides TaxID=273540 RepID=A0A9Q0KCU9_9MAGN|nr:hypothetical protein NE237_014909 [Protea cynaroides]